MLTFHHGPKGYAEDLERAHEVIDLCLSPLKYFYMSSFENPLLKYSPIRAFKASVDVFIF